MQVVARQNVPLINQFGDYIDPCSVVSLGEIKIFIALKPIQPKKMSCFPATTGFHIILTPDFFEGL